MGAYQTVVVGTDGSETSLRAVDRAGTVAAESKAKLIIATGHSRSSGAHRSSAILHKASQRAKAAGVTDIEQQSIPGAAVDALVGLAQQVNADLLVVGRVGLDAIIGRIFSVPGNVSRRAKTDVLIVHTTG